MKKGVLLAALAVGASLGVAAPAQAQAGFGAQALFGSETDFGLGARVVAGLGSSIPLEFQGGFNLFFPDGPRDYWEINGNVWYTIETDSTGAPYVGGGLNIGRMSGGDAESNTELAVNLGGGYRFGFTNTSPFIEARFAVGGHDQFVIGGGVLLGNF